MTLDFYVGPTKKLAHFSYLCSPKYSNKKFKLEKISTTLFMFSFPASVTAHDVSLRTVRIHRLIHIPALKHVLLTCQEDFLRCKRIGAMPAKEYFSTINLGFVLKGVTTRPFTFRKGSSNPRF